MAALLMFSALKNNDKVGLVQFCDDVEQYFPPRKGKANVLRLIRELVTVKPVRRPTSLAAAVQFLNRVHKRRAVVFVISDFLDVDPEQSLVVAGRRHDMIAIQVSDPREVALPDVGLITLQDAETGEVVEVDTGNPRVRALYRQQAEHRQESLTTELRRSGVDQLAVGTREPYSASLLRFFRKRERRVRS